MLPYQRWVFDNVTKTRSPRQRRFLEIGGVPTHQSIARGLLDLGAMEVVQINSRADLPESSVGGLTYLPLDAREPYFEEESFDVIYGASVLEHLQQLPDILTENCRLLRPGGLVCLHGGALWSSHWGHHVWVHTQGTKYEFNANNPVPDWGHLYLSPLEMFEYLVERNVPTRHAELICDWIYVRQDINRYTINDYLSMIHDAPLDLVEMQTKAWKSPDAEALARLRSVSTSRNISDYSVGEACIVLTKRAKES